MPIIDIDKITIQKVVKGINCTSCNGNLKAVAKKNLARKIISAITFGKVNANLYQCETCNKLYTVI